MTENPVECARVYDMQVRTFLSELVCSPLADGPGRYRSSSVIKDQLLNKKGAFGKTSANHGVSEVQARGGLHLHGIAFHAILLIECMSR